jgi:hypothetical protein
MSAGDQLEQSVGRALRGDDRDVAAALADLEAAVGELRAAQIAGRTQVPMGQVKTLRVQLNESDMLSGLVDSPRSSLAGLFLIVCGVVKYVDPALLGELLHLIEQNGDAGAVGLAAAGVSLLLGKYGAPAKEKAESDER